MSSDDISKSKGMQVGHHPESHPPPPAEPVPPPLYGTFQGVPAHPPPRPLAAGLPQPAPPPGAAAPYDRGYQTAPGYQAVAEGRPARARRLPCCGCGLGWCLFIIGFFLAGIPWYVGAILLITTRRRMDVREKPGYIACVIAAVLLTIAIIVGVTKI